MTERASSTDRDVEHHQLLAHGCQNDHFTVPGHPRCPACGEPQEKTLDLTKKTGIVKTWTRVAATPPGVREPNTLAIVEFALEVDTVSMLGGTIEQVSLGEQVRPVYIDTLRDADESVRQGANQSWGGFRFEPVSPDE
ncbi:nucleic acid-binding protein [Halovenus rubra]|uniref:Nucleic acid-binding protein n=2 Tax=Halovenus rubra TaxID=869890 RepID=A0ABD5XCV9_9EURY|nr:nucleic acid-binding protein [Halovenus rubra]